MDIINSLLHFVNDPMEMMSPLDFNRTSGLVVSVDGASFITTYDGTRIGQWAKDRELTAKAIRFRDNAKNGYNLRLSKATYDESHWAEAKSEGSLLGILPWSSKLIPVGEGQYKALRLFDDRLDKDWRGGLMPNEWAGHNLTLKLQTIGIIGVSSIVGYYGIKYLRKRR